jgi:nucleotide-binding universal stress UspA family protein
MVTMRIVVGADGSAGSVAAVRWAAAEARLRNAELRVLTAYHRDRPGLFIGGGRPDQAAAGLVRAAVAQARAVDPAIEVRGMALPGYAAPVLQHAAEEAGLLVVGDSGGGHLFSLGSVCGQVATHARRSVVVVRGRPGADTGPVVVGVDDDSPAVGVVVGRAFEEASLHGAPLLAVTVRSRPKRAGPTAAEALGADIDPQLDPWREKFPDVAVEHRVVTGRPEEELLLSCREARLVVVGPRRHGYEGVMLGPIGSRLLQRADCPVLIARS